MSQVELIGGQLVPNQSFEAITQISSNRTLLVQQLTSKPTKPEPITGLKTIDEAFQHFKPSVEVGFDKPDGTTAKEELRFANLGDFGKEGLINQSAFLSNTRNRQDAYHKIAKQLRTNKILKAAMQSEESRQAILKAIEIMMAEIDQANN